MDIFGIPLWLYLLTVVMALIVYYMWYMSMDFNIFEKMRIDGPGPMPILGNLGHILIPGLYHSQLDMYKCYKDKKVYGIFDSRTPCLVVADLKIIEDILVKHFDKFPNRERYIHGDSILHHCLPFLQDNQWKRVRGVVNSVLSNSDNLRKIPHRLEKVNVAMLDYLKEQLEEDDDVELRELSTLFTLDSLLASCFGIETNSFQDPEYAFSANIRKIRFTLWLSKMVHFFFPFLKGVCRFIGLCSCEKSVTFFTTITDCVISKEKEYSPLIQLISRNAELNQGNSENAKTNFQQEINTDSQNIPTDPLAERDIQGQAFTLILCAYKTVTTVMSYTIFMLANNPEYCDKVQDEIDKLLELESNLTYDNVGQLVYLDMCINETMRMFPAGVNVNRVCLEDITIQGFRFPKGMPVFLPVYAIHHDPEFWQDPEDFMPERFDTECTAKQRPFSFLPFGGGPRKCVGIDLALLHIKIGIATILRRMTPSPCYTTVYPVKLSRFSNEASNDLWVKMDVR